MSDSLIEKKVSSEKLYEGYIVDLSIDTIELPNGKMSKREVIHHSGAVAIVPIDPDGNVVMVKQFRYAAGRVLLEIPAGTLEDGEDPHKCAIRELQEEVSLKPGRLQKLGGIFVAPGYTTEFIHLYLATDLSESKLNMDEDEFIEVVRLTLPEALNKIAAGEIIDAKSVSGLFMAKAILDRAETSTD